MLTDTELAGCQQMQLAIMLDVCEIREPDYWSTETRQPGPIAWQYLGGDQIPCRAASAGGDMAGNRGSTAGGQGLTLNKIVVTLPVTIHPLPGQVITIVSAEHDPLLAGRRFVVDTAQPSTWLTARRVLCTENLE